MRKAIAHLRATLGDERGFLGAIGGILSAGSSIVGTIGGIIDGGGGDSPGGPRTTTASGISVCSGAGKVAESDLLRAWARAPQSARQTLYRNVTARSKSAGELPGYYSRADAGDEVAQQGLILFSANGGYDCKDNPDRRQQVERFISQYGGGSGSQLGVQVTPAPAGDTRTIEQRIADAAAALAQSLEGTSTTTASKPAGQVTQAGLSVSPAMLIAGGAILYLISKK